MALLYAGSIVCWAAAARHFGAWAAIAVAAVLLVYQGYALMFHEISSEPMFAAAFALWALLLTRAAFGPSVRRFALVGLGIALLALVRPGNAVLIAFAVFPFVLAGAWRDAPALGRRGGARRGASARRVVSAQRPPVRHLGSRPWRERDRPVLPCVHHRPRRLARERRELTTARRGDAGAPAHARPVPLVRGHPRPALRAGELSRPRGPLPAVRRGVRMGLRLRDPPRGRCRGRAGHTRACTRGVARTIWDELAKAQFRVVSAPASGKGPPAAATVVIHGKRRRRRPRASRSQRGRSSGSRDRTTASGRSGRRRPNGTSSSPEPPSVPASSASNAGRGALRRPSRPRRERPARTPPQPAVALVPASLDVDPPRPRGGQGPSTSRWPILPRAGAAAFAVVL